MKSVEESIAEELARDAAQEEAENRIVNHVAIGLILFAASMMTAAWFIMN